MSSLIQKNEIFDKMHFKSLLLQLLIRILDFWQKKSTFLIYIYRDDALSCNFRNRYFIDLNAGFPRVNEKHETNSQLHRACIDTRERIGIYLCPRRGEETSDGNGRQRRPHVYSFVPLCVCVTYEAITTRLSDFKERAHAFICRMRYKAIIKSRLYTRGESFDYVITIASRKHFWTSRIGEL